LGLSDSEPEASAPVSSGLGAIRELPRGRQIAVAVTCVALIVADFARFGLSGRAVVDAFFACVLVLLAAIDLDRRLIPNAIVLPALAICLVAQIALFPQHALEWILSSLFAALALFLPLLVVPAGMGMGDVKLAALMGAVLGKSVVVALFVGVLAGGLFAAGLLVRRGVDARKQTIAYGPFLAFGGLVVLLLGGH
jgi:leader peptidase (prepilin peptidase)/N-methyltransferase